MKEQEKDRVRRARTAAWLEEAGLPADWEGEGNPEAKKEAKRRISAVWQERVIDPEEGESRSNVVKIGLVLLGEGLLTVEAWHQLLFHKDHQVRREVADKLRWAALEGHISASHWEEYMESDDPVVVSEAVSALPYLREGGAFPEGEFPLDRWFAALESERRRSVKGAWEAAPYLIKEGLLDEDNFPFERWEEAVSRPEGEVGPLRIGVAVKNYAVGTIYTLVKYGLHPLDRWLEMVEDEETAAYAGQLTHFFAQDGFLNRENFPPDSWRRLLTFPEKPIRRAARWAAPAFLKQGVVKPAELNDWLDEWQEEALNFDPRPGAGFRRRLGPEGFQEGLREWEQAMKEGRLMAHEVAELNGYLLDYLQGSK